MQKLTLFRGFIMIAVCSLPVYYWLSESTASKQSLPPITAAAHVDTVSETPIKTNLKNPLSTMQINPNSIELIHGDGDVQHAVIWLHGLGATANDFPPVVPELGLPKQRAIRFVFPQAPDRPITINGGMRMPGWYDIKGMDIKDKQDAEGMADSHALLEQLIQAQIDLGVPSQHIIIAGFSQGGAVAYFTGLRTPHRLAGILALSTYLPFAQQSEAEHSAVNLSTPIFASHGSFDPVVPLTLGETSVAQLKSLGYAVQWQVYPMEHNVIMPQIKDIGEWINGVFSKADKG